MPPLSGTHRKHPFGGVVFHNMRGHKHLCAAFDGICAVLMLGKHPPLGGNFLVGFKAELGSCSLRYVRDVIDIGKKAKILRETADLSVYFLNKNHLSYFIAKYLIRASQGEPADTSGIEYALENICFGINADIVLFISYILNNTRILTSISNYAGKLLEPWDALSFSEKNISILHNVPLEQINPPSEEERKKYDDSKEKSEEINYSEDTIEAKGLFDYDDGDIDRYQYRLVRAIKYTEMICKALPAFHNTLKISQKNELVDSVYLYPRKIVYALLRPLDMNIKDLCEDILEYAKQNEKKKKDGSE